jgi:nitrilase
MGDGSTLPIIETPHGRLSGLTCWENFMPLARYYLFSQGVDIWGGPNPRGQRRLDRRHATHRSGRPLLCHRRQPLSPRRPDPGRLSSSRPPLGQRSRQRRGWIEPGNSVIIHPTGRVLAGPARHEETILYAEVELAAARRPPALRPSRPLQPPRHLPTPGGYPLPTCGRARSPSDNQTPVEPTAKPALLTRDVG